MAKKPAYWVEARESGRKLASGTCIACLEDVDEKSFPVVVMTSKSVSALGELVCVCANRIVAEDIARYLNDAEVKPHAGRD